MVNSLTAPFEYETGPSTPCHQAIFGTSALLNPRSLVKEPLLTLPGICLDGTSCFSIDEKTLSRHLLLLGGSGCGKTTVFEHMLHRLIPCMTDKDFAIIFDTKGEYYDLFHGKDDYVIGNGGSFRDISMTWNIFDEVLADGWNDVDVTINAHEIAAALFHGRGSSSQPFFCNAARDIFAATLIHFIRSFKRNPEKWGKRLNNADLLQAFKRNKAKDYISIFSYYPDMNGLLTYFGDGKSNQALGVFGELNSMISDYFIGVFADHKPGRSGSMRNAVRKRGGRILFVEYDLSVGETLSPIYRLLFDQVLKEALSRQNRSSEERGKVYVVTDEFKLLPQLQHIDDALNFGRGLGVNVLAGIQSIDQLYDIYGRDKGAVIASGFGSIFAFHTNDDSSRDYITRRFGSNVVNYSYYSSIQNKMCVRERDGATVENWDQINLGLGQAFIGLGYDPPFLFQFDDYKEGGLHR